MVISNDHINLQTQGHELQKVAIDVVQHDDLVSSQTMGLNNNLMFTKHDLMYLTHFVLAS